MSESRDKQGIDVYPIGSRPPLHSKDLLEPDEPAWKFWNPMSGLAGGMLAGLLAGLLISAVFS